LEFRLADPYSIVAYLQFLSPGLLLATVGHLSSFYVIVIAAVCAEERLTTQLSS